MGIQDREYYWKDRKRREERFKNKSRYHNNDSPVRTGWKQLEYFKSSAFGWKLLLAFLIGGGMAFVLTMFVLQINTELIRVPYQFVGELIRMFSPERL